MALISTATLYVVVSLLLFPGDFRALLPANFLQMEYFGIPFTLVMLVGESFIRDRDKPTLYLLSICRERGRRILAFHFFLVLGLTAYTTFKVNIPGIMPFYADPLLYKWDRILHGGSPWEYVHRLPEWFGAWINVTYARVWALLLVALPYGMAIWAGSAVAKRYMWTLFFAYAGIGTGLAAVFSSVGPIFYGDFYADDPYTRLRELVFSDPHLSGIQLYTHYLLDNFHSGASAFGTGISAMPSVHIATSTLFAWTLTSYGRVTAVLGWLFLISIELGSVYTGWHYALDGYVSFTLVSAVWIILSRRLGLPLMPPRENGQAAGKV